MRRWLGFGLLVATGLAIVVAQFLRPDVSLAEPLLTGTALMIYAAFGGLIIARRDGHLTGWLLTLSGVVIVFADGFGRLSFVDAAMADWQQSWAWTAVFAVFAAMTLTFPSGHAPTGSGFLARLGRILLVSLPFLVVVGALTQTWGGPEASAGQLSPIGFLPPVFAELSLLGVVLTLLGGTVSLIVKRRGATGIERAQLTWVVFALALFVTMIVLTLLYIFIVEELTGTDPGDAPWTPVFLMMSLFPISFGVAILRYRLFDIDRIVSRTVTYTIVGAFLAATFFAVVTLLSTLIPTDDSSWQVAASTLIVAALFNPARRRVRKVVDRRYNRSHYDSQRVAAELSEQIRDEIDPLVIGAAWTDAVTATMEPAAISLWLKQR